MPPSIYWDFFEKSKDGEYGICKHCPSRISTRGSQTTGLKRHLIVKHRKVYEEEILTKTNSEPCEKTFPTYLNHFVSF